MNSIDPLQLQRLVDGELELEQIQAMLQEAESKPENWRDIATSFIEDHLFTRSIAQSQQTATTLESELLATEPTQEPAPVVSPSSPTKKLPGQSDDGHSWVNWLLLAACILVAMGVGYSLNPNTTQSMPVAGSDESNNSVEPFSNSLASANSPNAVDPRNASDPNTQITPAVFTPKYHLEVPESRGILSRENVGPISPVPLYSVQNVRQLREFQKKQFASNRISPELVKQMSEAGYHMKQDIEFISGNLNKDKKFLVPVRTIRFMPRQ